MPHHRRGYSSSNSSLEAVIIDRSPEVRSRHVTHRTRREGLTFGFKFSDLFKPKKKTRVISVVRETSVPRKMPRQAHHFRAVENSPSPPRTHREPRLMTEEGARETFVPLPPKIPPRRHSSSESDDSRSFIIENRSPKRKSSKKKEKRGHHRKDSKLDSERERYVEVIEIPSSPRRTETETERLRRRRAEREANEAETVAREERVRRNNVEYIATRNADAAVEERRRADRAEDITRRLQDVYIEERDGRMFATREAAEAHARALELERRLAQERREKNILERENEVLEQERRLAEAQRPPAATYFHDIRPVDIHQEPWPPGRDPGGNAIRRAQNDVNQRRQHMRDDDSFYGHRRERPGGGRRGSLIIHDDDDMRAGNRRR